MASPVGDSVARITERLTIRGVVQGVGFRPHVYRLATSLGLGGRVRNGSDGVEGTEERLGHGREHTRVGIGRAGPEQQTSGGRG